MCSQLFLGGKGSGTQPALRYGRHSEDITLDSSMTVIIFYKLDQTMFMTVNTHTGYVYKRKETCVCIRHLS